MYSVCFSMAAGPSRSVPHSRAHVSIGRVVSAILLLCSYRVGHAQPPSLVDSLQADLHKARNGLPMTLENVGSSIFMLNVGGIIGKTSFPRVRLSLDGACREKGMLLDTSNGGGALSGRGDPWVVVLPPQASYSLFFLFAKLVPRNTMRPLVAVPDGCTLRAEFTGSIAVDSAPGGRPIKFSITRNGPTDIPFWVGKVSATLSP